MGVKYPQIEHLVRGVFKGGGAKGLVYCGALHELRARGIWFHSVAGSSAGAITSMLIACGLDPVALAGLADDALKTVRRNRTRWLTPGGEKAIFRTDELRAWLEARLQAAIGVQDRPEPVTFAELAAAGHDIELNVVALDLATQQPIVFNTTTAGSSSISASVVASSAIPVVMPTQRVAHREGEKRAIHRVVDGGAWANYPTFVYRDRSFRRFHGLEPVDASSDVLGFVIEAEPYRLPDENDATSTGWPPPPPEFPSRDVEVLAAASRPSPFDHGAGRRMGVAGALASWTGLRWATTALVVVAFIVVAPQAWLGLARDDFDVLDQLPAALRGPLIVAVYMTLVLAVIASIAVVVAQARIAMEAVDNGMPAVSATMAVGPSVPSWVGYDDEDRVVRLSAPLGIDTTTFKATPAQRFMALFVSGAQASTQLDRRFSDRARAPLPDAAALADDPALPLQGAALYRAMGGGPKVVSSVGLQGGATFVVGFWMFILGAVGPFYTSTRDFFIGVAIMAGFVLHFAKRGIRGRRLNMSALSDELPQQLPVVRRVVLGLFLIATSAAFLTTADELRDEDASSLLLVVPFGFLGLFGAGCIASAVARAVANRQRLRYLQELTAI